VSPTAGFRGLRSRQALLQDDHFRVAALRRGGEPCSLVFLTKWTIRLAGHDVCEEAHERGREGALVTAYS
jgi:hypothetical protein